MAHEIERKFLVHQKLWEGLVKSSFKQKKIKQLYLHADSSKAIRVRVMNDEAYITIKSKISSIKRLEYEYEIPLKDAEEMLEVYKDAPSIQKTRYLIPSGYHTWEVDVFDGANQGLVVAEIELSQEDEAFTLPNWVSDEVTQDEQYLNANLALKK